MNSSAPTDSSQLVQFNPTSQLPLKLTDASNFANWKAQFSSLMYGYDIYACMDGKTLPPPRTTTVDNQETSKPQYKIWFRQDHLIRNAMMASIDSTITSIIVVSATSKHAWDALHNIYANKSHTRIFSLRNTLTKVSKDNKSIVEYLREVRTITDELATAGALVTNEELVVKS